MEDEKKIEEAKDWIKNLEVSTKAESTNKDVLIEYLEQIEVLQNKIKILEKQEEENKELKELCIKIAKRLEILGHKHLAKYMLARIDVENLN